MQNVTIKPFFTILTPRAHWAFWAEKAQNALNVTIRAKITKKCDFNEKA